MDTGLFNEKIFLQIKIDKLVNEMYAQLSMDTDVSGPINSDESDTQIFQFLKIFASTNAREKIDLILSKDSTY